ncbi:MAG: sigma-70 family RNA polymerase sigma factor [Acidobacteriota bacterium]
MPAGRAGISLGGGVRGVATKALDVPEYRHVCTGRAAGVSAMRDDPADTDTTLRNRLLAGDESAFEEVVASLHGSMLRFARQFISRADVAEETVQETWLAVLNGLSEFEGRSSFKTWVFRILANRARTRAVREGRVVPFADLVRAGDVGLEPDLAGRFSAGGHWSRPPGAWDADSPESILLRHEAMSRLEEALETLPASQRTVVTLRDMEGLTAEDVCNILDISETNQRVLLHRARTRLRRALEGVLSR